MFFATVVAVAASGISAVNGDVNTAVNTIGVVTTVVTVLIVVDSLS